MPSPAVTAWRLVPAVCALLAVPTLVTPDSVAARATYLAALVLVVAGVWRGALQLRGADRRAWALLALAASAWLAGDTTQIALAGLDVSTDDVGLPDIFWLASYPLLFAAVATMLGARMLPRSQRTEIMLDVLAVAVAAAVSSWQLLVRPALADGPVSAVTLVSALYPLDDVMVFALALALVLAPGGRGTPSLLLISCFALTLPLDCAQSLLALLLPDHDGADLDGLLAVVNGLLGGAALHPRRGELTAPPARHRSTPMHRWRIVLLGASLAAVSVTSALSSGLQALAPSLVATLVVTGAVVLRFYGVVRDRDRAEAALRHRAHHDQLTGAANRTLFMERLADELAAGTPADLALVFLDLDGFKAVNDEHGHPAGDEVLAVVTRRLNALARGEDTVSRLGGDEFVVLCPDTDAAGAQALAQRITGAVGQPVPLSPDGDAPTVQVGASVGVLAVDGSQLAELTAAEGGLARAADTLLRLVDEAMYTAKRDGGGIRTAQLVRC